MAERLPGLFVVGTDTGVGKTYVASAIAGRWWPEGGKWRDQAGCHGVRSAWAMS